MDERWLGGGGSENKQGPISLETGPHCILSGSLLLLDFLVDVSGLDAGDELLGEGLVGLAEQS